MSNNILIIKCHNITPIPTFPHRGGRRMASAFPTLMGGVTYYDG